MSVLTIARSGLARSGASRSGFPVAQGTRVPLYALSGVARSGATRSNYHSGRPFFAIAGVTYGTSGATRGILYAGLSIEDTLNSAPNTMTFTAVDDVVVTPGQEVVLTLGSVNNLSREFGGFILSVDVGYWETPANAYRTAQCIDYGWGLGARKVSGYYVGTASAIFASLLATYAPGYTGTAIAAGLPTVTGGITFTNEDLRECFTRLMKRVGGDWYCDYTKDCHAFLDDATTTDPAWLNSVHPSLSHLKISTDLSQTVTRVYIEGGGVTAAATVVVGETMIPLDGSPTWYQSTGGVVVSGPQRIVYTGVLNTGGGGLVGPGASPSGALVANLASGAGVTDGAHDYAVTFVTAAGESLPSPRATLTVGVLDPPAAPVATTDPSAGTGPEVGDHDYAVTFTTSTGETTAGTRVTKSTGYAAVPTDTPNVGAATPGGGVTDGGHDYAVTFLTAGGETPPGPISSQVTTGIGAQVSAPSSSGTLTNLPYGYAVWDTGDVIEVAIGYVTAGGVTNAGPLSAPLTAVHASGGGPTQSCLMTLSGLPVSGDGTVTAKRIWFYKNGAYYAYYDTYPAATTLTVGSSWSLGAGPGANTTGTMKTVPLTAIPLGPAGVTSRKLYRRSGGAGLKLLATLADNTTTTYTDTTANGSLGAAPPSTNTATLRQVALTGIPTGGPLVTGRKVYRTAVGSAQLKLLTTIANNTTTTYTDSTVDASLGANVPTTNTATGNQVSLTAIPVGAAGVTSRKIYRTAAGAAQLKLLTTLADNTTAVYTDTTADGSLGANVTVTDTSGLAQAAGFVAPGSTTLQVATIGGFPASGWAVIGNGQQVIRYSGITGSVLTGIPASGVGAITAAIGYNSTVTSPPMLTGVPASGTGAIRYAILKGDDVNIFVQVDDVAAQAALVARIGGDGIQEDYLQDRRLAFAECVARGTAQLALKSAPVVTVTYDSRDLNTRAGRIVTVNIGAPFNLAEMPFRIQHVVETFLPTAPPLATFSVTASSLRFSYDELLRGKD